MKQNNIPPAAGAVFDDLVDQVFRLKSKWLVFRELFGDKSHVDLLNKCAPATFSYYLFALLDDVSLTLTRLLTDPAEIHGRENSNFEQLIRKLDPGQDQAIITSLEARLASLRQKCAAFKTRRNRLLAHRDWKTVQPIRPQRLSGISRAMVEGLLPDMESFLNEFSEYFNQRALMLSPGDIRYDVRNLLTVLEAGLSTNPDLFELQYDENG